MNNAEDTVGIPVNEMTYIAVAVRGVDRVIRVRVVWRKLWEGSGSPDGGGYVLGRYITQGMEHAAKWREDDNHVLGISAGCKRKVVVAGRYRGNGRD